jgi:predicted hotdog family 3-hydroxylacyl-ACP dehydratase
MTVNIADLIPHSGSMCLLDRLMSHDDNHCHAQANSHRDPNNPLRSNGQLGIAASIEYAAQAMALHGALTTNPSQSKRGGRLTSIRAVQFHALRLDDHMADLSIHVERSMGDEVNVIYQFSVNAGDHCLASGRASVMLVQEAT